MSQGFFEVKAKANIGSIEFNTLPSGDLVANLSLAATKKYKDNQGILPAPVPVPITANATLHPEPDDGDDVIDDFVLLGKHLVQVVAIFSQ